MNGDNQIQPDRSKVAYIVSNDLIKVPVLFTARPHNLTALNYIRHRPYSQVTKTAHG